MQSKAWNIHVSCKIKDPSNAPGTLQKHFFEKVCSGYLKTLSKIFYSRTSIFRCVVPKNGLAFQANVAAADVDSTTCKKKHACD